jgi:hypothetical protein
LKPFIDKLQIPALRNRLALRTFICASLAKELKQATPLVRPAAILRYEQALNEWYGLRLILDLLESKEGENGGTDALPSAAS